MRAKRESGIRLGLPLIVAGAFSLAGFGPGHASAETIREIHVVSAAGPEYLVLDFVTQAVVRELEITVPGETVARAKGLTSGIEGGELHVLLELAGVPGDVLVWLDSDTGEAWVAGNTGHDFASVALVGLDLVGVTTSADSTPNALYQLDYDTGAATLLCSLAPSVVDLAIGSHFGEFYRVAGGLFEVGYTENPCDPLSPLAIPASLRSEPCVDLGDSRDGRLLWAQADGDIAIVSVFGSPAVDVTFSVGLPVAAVTGTSVSVIPRYIRGDVNGDGVRDIGDVIDLLTTLFAAGAPDFGCEVAADVNDNEAVDISDAIYLLSYLFIVGSPPPPGPDVCGESDLPRPLGCEIPQC